jgi:hypothetical protein
MNKRHQHIPDMFEAARKCKRAGIRVTLQPDLRLSGRSRNAIAAKRCGDGRYRGAFRQRQLFAERLHTVSRHSDLAGASGGLRSRSRCSEWADIDLGSNKLPWLQRKSLSRRCSAGFRIFCWITRSTRRAPQAIAIGAVQSLAAALARKPLHWRIRNYSFGWPLELWLSMAKQWLVVRRSLLTGQSLSHELSPKHGKSMADVLLTHSNHLYFDRKQTEKMQPYPPLQTMLAAAVLRERGIECRRCSTPTLSRPRPPMGF